MGRPKQFDRASALDAAIGVFREHGYAGTSASMLVDALGIARQSLYDTFGDKWSLYLEAVRKYSTLETRAHISELRSGPNALAGLRSMIARVVSEAKEACLGVSSICEFGTGEPTLSEIQQAAGRVLSSEIADSVRKGQQEGDIAVELDAEQVSGFLVASIGAIRLAARGGADQHSLDSLGNFALRALR